MQRWLHQKSPRRDRAALSSRRSSNRVRWRYVRVGTRWLLTPSMHSVLRGHSELQTRFQQELMRQRKREIWPWRKRKRKHVRPFVAIAKVGPNLRGGCGVIRGAFLIPTYCFNGRRSDRFHLTPLFP